MSKKILHDGDEGVLLIVRDVKRKRPKKGVGLAVLSRAPVHVVYGGANLFRSGTPRKLGDIALRSLETYVPYAAEFAVAMGLDGRDSLPAAKEIVKLEKAFDNDPLKLKSENYPAWLATTVYSRTAEKLKAEPVEDFRIDFEDGYGFRSDAEEDADADNAAGELVAASNDKSNTAFSGFRIKAYAPETRDRAKRTLKIFLEKLLKMSDTGLPPNFVVTLPKVTEKKQVADLCSDLKKIEKKAGLNDGSIKIEIMIEHPLAIIDRKGNPALKALVDASRGRCVAAHFGAYDYTASLGIAASHQDLTHPACDFARQMMLVSLKPLGLRLSDSVTTQIPVPIHKGEKLTRTQKAENKAAVIAGWRGHFRNITRSMIGGFYQSWDLHPNQLVARYAAVYSFFLNAADSQAARLRGFFEKATQATLTGNAFDDAATATGIVNFFKQGLSCGALSEEEIRNATGLTAADLGGRSFNQIVDGKNRPLQR